MASYYNMGNIAVIYDYTGENGKFHVFPSTGTSFDCWGMGEVDAGFFQASKVTGRMVAGDFNGDGKGEIMAIKDEGSNKASILM